MRLLESLGLGLLLASMVIGVSSLWLHSTSGQSLAQRFPRLTMLLHARAFMLVVMMSGVCLLLLSIFMPTSAVPPIAPVQSNPLPREPTPSRTDRSLVIPMPASTVSEPVIEPTSVPAPAPVPPVVPPDQSAVPEKNRGPLPLPELPAKPQRPIRQALPRIAPVPDVRAGASDAVPQKKNIFSARCARLVEKIGAGEPMTPQEQHEMVSKCQ